MSSILLKDRGITSASVDVTFVSAEVCQAQCEQDEHCQGTVTDGQKNCFTYKGITALNASPGFDTFIPVRNSPDSCGELGQACCFYPNKDAAAEAARGRPYNLDLNGWCGQTANTVVGCRGGRCQDLGCGAHEQEATERNRCCHFPHVPECRNYGESCDRGTGTCQVLDTSCGLLGDSCCPDDSCHGEDLSCQEVKPGLRQCEQACGGLGQACCSSLDPCLSEGLRCAVGTEGEASCVACGGPKQACCAGGLCFNSDLACEKDGVCRLDDGAVKAREVSSCAEDHRAGQDRPDQLGAWLCSGRFDDLVRATGIGYCPSKEDARRSYEELNMRVVGDVVQLESQVARLPGKFWEDTQAFVAELENQELTLTESGERPGGNLCHVSFRGTSRFMNILEDLDIFPAQVQTPAGERLALAGFTEAYRQLAGQLEATLAQMTGCKSYMYSGHSLGGAMALLAGLAHKAREPSANISVVSAGAPKIFTETVDLPQDMGVYRAVNDVDLVPHVYPFAAHVGTEVFLPTSPAGSRPAACDAEGNFLTGCLPTPQQCAGSLSFWEAPCSCKPCKCSGADWCSWLPGIINPSYIYSRLEEIPEAHARYPAYGKKMGCPVDV